jgi:hypothetical protein
MARVRGRIIPFSAVNYLAIVIAAAAAWLVGAAWYMTLAKPWMAAQGFASKEAMLAAHGKPSPVPFALSFAAELVMAFGLTGVLGHIGRFTLMSVVMTGVLLWFSFVLTTMVVNNAFAARKFMLTVIDSGHWLAVLVVIGAIVGLMGPRSDDAEIAP